MKLLASLIVGLLLALVTLPAVMASGDVPPLGCAVIGGDMGAILQTIRTLESGGRYDAQAPGSSASGAYQFIDSTWANYGGYVRAVDAPPEVQDAKAVEAVTGILAANGSDVGAVPVVWYIGHVPVGAEWDRVPFPGAGNVLTPRQYQTKWLTIYRTIAPAAVVEPTNEADPEQPSEDLGPTSAEENDEAGVEEDAVLPAGCVGGSIEPLPGGWSLPVPRHLLTLEAIRRSHHGYPAWDFGTPAGTPVYAIRGGTVTSITNYRYNWFDAGCVRGGACDACGVGVTVTDSDGARWTYCHGSNLTVPGPGATVDAGTQLMWTGNSGRSTGPHLHLSIRTADGVRRCPQPLLESLYSASKGAKVASLTTTGCTH